MVAWKGMPSFLLSTKTDDPTIELLEARFGIKGYAVWIKLLCRIYGDKGYYCIWSKEISEVFAAKIVVNAQLVSDVVEFLVRRDFFDQKRFEELGILTSTSIQNHFVKTNSRKKEVVMLESFLCDNFNENVYKNLKIVDKNGKNVCRNKPIERNEIECNEMECNLIELKNKIEDYLGEGLDIEEEKILERMTSFYDMKMIIYAFREAEIKGIKSMKYAEGILKNWKEQGYTAKQYEEEY
ncbi:MAG: DUF4373 domain-containing protein [Candidatus Izemoplasmatales bacterium]|nr:DUF4373 domain-containing protein [Candidatus Izemoplasmatales bacterium]